MDALLLRTYQLVHNMDGGPFTTGQVPAWDGNNWTPGPVAADKSSASAQVFTGPLSEGPSGFSLPTSTQGAYLQGSSIGTNAASGSTNVLLFSVANGTDTVAQFAATAAGQLGWGPGSGARDTTLGRTAAGVLTLTGGLIATTSLLSTGAGGVGYATGAGGAVTQATNKSTGVTLNKTCGVITMNNASLTTGLRANFTVTNSTVAATDTVHACVASVAGGSSLYSVDVVIVGSGSFTLSVLNFGGVTEGVALVINFAVIKATSS